MTDDAGKLVLRLAVGVLMLLHGIHKLLHGVDGIAGMLAGMGLPAFLAYGNYRAILKWNRSTFFALAVGSLAERIGGR